ncbi:hypothetical protein Pmani_028426 [Petrolisthes manimaculis]|uniref:Uncharacterized protein n=1 Tax=Petrolisthes manimaculis TaxID=1843537 RepID=A0AAE1TY13_9EUCA|nr:hypothetical protein Pmani_028426 [Petrolisthes manimaculis]
MVTLSERRPRPRLTSHAQDEAIQQAVRDDPFTNAVYIRERLQLDVNCTAAFEGGRLTTQDSCKKGAALRRASGCKISLRPSVCGQGAISGRGSCLRTKKHSTAQTMESSTTGNPIIQAKKQFKIFKS